MLSKSNILSTVLDIPYCHHEKWNGTGYPRGLKEEEIPLMARIVSVADGYDTGTSDRPYAGALSKAEVLKFIQNLSGSHFDPAVVKALTELLQE